MSLTAGEQTFENVVLQGLSIVATVAGAVGGLALPEPLAAIPLLVKLVEEAKTIQEVAAAGGKAIPTAVAVFQAIEALGIKPMGADEMAKMKPEDGFA